MTNIIERLSGLGVPALQRLLGKEVLTNISLLQVGEIDSFRSEKHLASLLLGKLQGELLLDDEVRIELLSTLSDQELSSLAELCGITVPRPFPRNDLKRILSKQSFSGDFARALVTVFGLGEEFLPQARPKTMPFEVIPVNWPNFALFDYQRHISDQLFNVVKGGEKRVLVHMPTGSGKTRTALEAVLAAWQVSGQPESYVVWLAPTEELCEQAVNTIRSLWPHRGQRSLTVHRIWRGVRPQLDIDLGGVVVASTPTISALLSSRQTEDREIVRQIRNSAYCIIFDEAHRALAETYEVIVESLVGSERPSGWVPTLIGLTATPGRATEDQSWELANLYGNNKISFDLTKLPDAIPGEGPLSYLQRNKYLARLLHYELETGFELSLEGTIVGGLPEDADLPRGLLKELGNSVERNRILVNLLEKEARENRPTLIFSCGVLHSQIISTILNARGVRAVAISGDTPSHIRKRAIDQFKAGDGSLPVLINYDILSTGFDAPVLKTLVIARPILSVVLYSQILGRALRGPKMGGQEECRVIDLKDNFERIPGIEHAFKFFENYWR